MNIPRRKFLKELSVVVGTAAVPSLQDIPSAAQQEEHVKTDRARSVLWAPEKGLGLDHVALEYRDQGIFADGVVIGFDNETPFRSRYRIHCDPTWKTRKVILESLHKPEARLELSTDGKGHWRTGTGDSLSYLDGCMDVDISATPFTNTLVIRRTSLKPGDSLELAVAYISVPAMRLTAEKQRYTCLEINGHGGRYRFEDASHDFRAEIQVDSDGLVTNYPALFNRVWPQ